MATDQIQAQPHELTGQATKKQSEEELKQKFKEFLETCIPYDPRFPNTNQTRNCQINYLDYQRCMHRKKDPQYCAWYKHAYETLCIPTWVERYDEQRANGTFPFDMKQFD